MKKRGKYRKLGRKMTPAEIEAERKRKAEYQNAYYWAHVEKAREYQRLYNITHKKKKMRQRGRYSVVKRERPAIREVYHSGDIMHAPVEKSLKMLKQILKGERWFTA
jgi:hypothetical protein